MYVGYIEKSVSRATERDETRGGEREEKGDDKGSPRRGDSRTSQPRYANRYVEPNMPAIICEINNGYLRTDRV